MCFEKMSLADHVGTSDPKCIVLRLLVRSCVSYQICFCVFTVSEALTRKHSLSCGIRKIGLHMKLHNLQHIMLQTKKTSFEPAHEIMALFVLRKLILQTRMAAIQWG